VPVYASYCTRSVTSLHLARTHAVGLQPTFLRSTLVAQEHVFIPPPISFSPSGTIYKEGNELSKYHYGCEIRSKIMD
jgi:hypothetical protein